MPLNIDKEILKNAYNCDGFISLLDYLSRRNIVVDGLDINYTNNRITYQGRTIIAISRMSNNVSLNKYSNISEWNCEQKLMNGMILNKDVSLFIKSNTRRDVISKLNKYITFHDEKYNHSDDCNNFLMQYDYNHSAEIKNSIDAFERGDIFINGKEINPFDLFKEYEKYIKKSNALSKYAERKIKLSALLIELGIYFTLINLIDMNIYFDKIKYKLSYSSDKYGEKSVLIIIDNISEHLYTDMEIDVYKYLIDKYNKNRIRKNKILNKYVPKDLIKEIC